MGESGLTLAPVEILGPLMQYPDDAYDLRRTSIDDGVRKTCHHALACTAADAGPEQQAQRGDLSGLGEDCGSGLFRNRFAGNLGVIVFDAFDVAQGAQRKLKPLSWHDG